MTGSLCGAWFTVWYIVHCVVHGSLCGTWLTVWYMVHLVIHGILCGTWYTVWYMVHCVIEIHVVTIKIVHSSILSRFELLIH